MSRAAVFSAGVAVAAFSDVLPTLSDAPSKGARRPGKDRLGLEDVRRRAHEEGYSAGVEEGREAGTAQAYADAQLQLEQLIQEQCAAFAQGLEEARSAFENSLPEWFRQSEESLTDMAFEAVRKILAAELQISRDSAFAIVRESLAEVTHATHARVRLNPFDSPAVAQNKVALMAVAGSLRSIDFVDDPAITGGCVIETDGGVIDASVDTRLHLFLNEAGEAA